MGDLGKQGPGVRDQGLEGRNSMKIYVVGKWVERVGERVVWEIQGVFSSAEKAVAVCNSPEWFVGPIELDELVPEGNRPWPGCYYPLDERVAG